MGKARDAKGLFAYRGQWIDQEPGRKGFYRYWYDEQSRRVKRKALEAVDLRSAEEELVKILSIVPDAAGAPSQVALSVVLAHYKDNYANPKGYKQMAAAKRAAELVLWAMDKIVPEPKVADLTRSNQRRVWKYLAEEFELSAKSITTYMISVRAAINYSATPQIIEMDGKEEEVRVLDSPVPVFCKQEEIAEHIGGDVSKPREYIPTYAELGRWIDAIEEEDDFRYVVIALNTCARNEAIFDLEISKQVNWEFGTIDLNPRGRRQTKKRRPVIRMTTNLAAWFEHWKDDKPIRQYQDTVEKRLNKVGKSEALNMPDMTCYTLRHFMATNMRRASFPVSKEQRSKWLGHSVNEGSKTTDWYEKFDPDYLEEPMRATEEIIRKIQQHTRRSLLAPTVHPQGTVRVVK